MFFCTILNLRDQQEPSKATGSRVWILSNSVDPVHPFHQRRVPPTLQWLRSLILRRALHGPSDSTNPALEGHRPMPPAYIWPKAHGFRGLLPYALMFEMMSHWFEFDYILHFPKLWLPLGVSDNKYLWVFGTTTQKATDGAPSIRRPRSVACFSFSLKLRGSFDLSIPFGVVLASSILAIMVLVAGLQETPLAIFSTKSHRFSGKANAGLTQDGPKSMFAWIGQIIVM